MDLNIHRTRITARNYLNIAGYSLRDFVYLKFVIQAKLKKDYIGKSFQNFFYLTGTPAIPAKLKFEYYDFGEVNNLADENPEIVSELVELMNSARIDSEDFPLKTVKNQDFKKLSIP